MLSQAKAKPPLNGAFVPIALNVVQRHTFSPLTLITAGWITAETGSDEYLQVDFEALYDVTALEFASVQQWYTEQLR